MKQQILPAVSAIIFDENKNVLLQRRGDTKKWCVISGHVEFGETVEHAIMREVFEETNCKCKVVRLIGVYSSPGYTTYDYADRTVQYVVSYFEVKLLNKVSEELKNHETEELKYFALDNLPPDIDQINPHWLEDALKSTEGFIR